MICDAKGKCLFGIYGPNPHCFPTAFNAEMLAVIRMLMFCTPPIRIWTDNQAVVDGWLIGEAWTTGSGKTAADLWRQFWFHIKSLRTKHQGARVDILKCKGHATELDVDCGRATIRTLNGNACADTFAVRGTIVAEARAPPSSTHYRAIIAFYRYLHSFSDERAARHNSL